MIDLPDHAGRSGLSMFWQSGGTRLHLTDPHTPSGVLLLADALTGLGTPAIDHHTTQAVGIHGDRWRGWNTKPREISWTVLVWSAGDEASFIETERRLWSTLSPHTPGVWTVTTPTGTTRRLECRFASTDDTPTTDHIRLGWARHTLHLVANDPFWYGTPLTQTWSNAAAANWLGGGDLHTPGSAFPVVISPATLADGVTVANPGDVPAWPVWTLTGPLERFSLTTDGATISGTIHLDKGQRMIIDTDPRRQTVLVDGHDRINELDSWQFAPIRPNTTGGLDVTMTGAGTLHVSLTPRYLRAY